jgi:Holliday junction resolvasome RuvABC ATP-dependent DNA helicase subunit
MIDMSEWFDYYGQDALKLQLQVHMTAAQMMKKPLPHVLLASGNPGYGKTAAAERIVLTMDGKMITLIPPFSEEVLLQALKSMQSVESQPRFIYIDEIHRMKKSSEMLLKLLEGGELYVKGRSVAVPPVTVIASTTEPDALPLAVLDRFKVKPMFHPYTMQDLVNIGYEFALHHDCSSLFNGEGGQASELLCAVASTCRSIPRIAGEYVLAIRALAYAFDRKPTVLEFLNFVDVDIDGVTANHRRYMQMLYNNFCRDGEYVAAESTLMEMLRETKTGLSRLEYFLLQDGFIEITSRGRALTDKGKERCAHWELVAANIIPRQTERM